MNLRLAFVSLLQFFLVSEVLANNYTFILESSIGDKFYINESSIEKSGNGYHVEILNSYGHADPFNKAWSSVQLINFDCNQYMQVTADKFYSNKMGKGSIIQSSNTSLPQMKVPNGSVFWVIQNKVCVSGNSSQTLENEPDDKIADFFAEIQKNSDTIGKALQYASSNSLMSKPEHFAFVKKLSAENTSNKSIFVIGSICQNLEIDICAKFLVEANNWPGGVDDYANMVTTLLESGLPKK